MDHIYSQIENIEVLFPFQPYPAQHVFMSSLIKAVDAKQNALLESPTGTGKTLSLLCAALGWLKQERAENKGGLV